MISILPLILLVGVASSKHISYYDDTTVQEPITTNSQERRICAELCMSGLGGEPCGDDCVDMTPQGLPLRSGQSESEPEPDKDETVKSRKGVCPVLCANRLGFPLCGCNYTNTYAPFFKADYVQICAQFCNIYNYQIYGCHSCDVYENATYDKMSYYIFGTSNFERKQVDWNLWCKQMCHEGEGGAACYCDLLPMNYL